MNEKLQAIWSLVTAPFPLFCIILIAVAIVVTARHERGQR